MMQVAAEDTHSNYVICRGFDTRISKFIDYAEGDSNKPGIPVAKPYGKRQSAQYQVGQVFAAILPLQSTNPSPTDAPFRFGQNPGVAAVSSGHPADLDEEVEILYTDEEKVVNWFLLDSGGGGSSLVRFELAEDMLAGECTKAFLRQFKNDDVENFPCGYWETDTTTEIYVQDQARQLCGWAGWEVSEGEWVRPTWYIEQNDQGGSIGDAWLPSDVLAEFGDNADEPVYEIVWMVEPCEFFGCYVDGLTEPPNDIYILSGDPLLGDAWPLITSRNKRFWQNTPPTYVPNVYNWYVDDEARMTCIRVNCHDYEPIQVACPPFPA